MVEYLYEVLINKNIIAFSHNIDFIFQYVKELYYKNPNIEIELKREIISTNKILDCTILFADLEIVEFYCGIYLTIEEHLYWSKYFERFYDNCIEYFQKNNKQVPRVMEDFILFMDYLGAEKIRKVIASEDFQSIHFKIKFEKEMDEELNWLIEKDK